MHMKKLFVTLLTLILISTSLFSGCARPVILGDVITKNYSFEGFDSVEVGQTFRFVQIGDLGDFPVELEVTKSDTFSVSIEANENIFDYIDVTQSNETLKIIVNRQRIATANATIRAVIAMPELVDINISGYVNAVAFSTASDFGVKASSGANLDLDLQVDNADFKVSSSSQVYASGRAKNLNSSVSAGSTLTMGLTSDNVTLKVSSSSRVSGSLETGTIRIIASAGSTVELTGLGEISEMEVSSSSQVLMPNFDFNGSLATVGSGANLVMGMKAPSAALKISSSSKATIQGSAGELDVFVSAGSNLGLDMQTNRCKLDMSSSSEVTGTLTTDNIDVNAGSGSRVTLVGSAKIAEIYASTSSSVIMANFETVDLNVTLSAGSRGQIKVNGTLNVNLSSSSTLIYEGNPILREVKVTEGSNIRRK
jgi:hypothetical protein